MQNKGTSWDEIYAKTIVAVVVLKNGEHIKILVNVYDGLHKGKSFRSPSGTVFKLGDVEKMVPIDDYNEKDYKT